MTLDGQTTLLVGAILLITFCLQGITGFGSTVLALPFIALLVGLKAAVPLLVALGWLQAAWIVVQARRELQWKPSLFIIGHMAIGLPIGFLLFDLLPERGLKGLLAAFMIVIGARELWAMRRATAPAAGEPRAGRSLLMRGILALGGVVHGAFGTGGPFVVIYASRALPKKSHFRSTLCLLWLVLNTALLVSWTVAGNVWTRPIGGMLIVTTPFVVAGMLAGDYLHHRTGERTFRWIVYGLMFASGLLMLRSAVV